MCTYSFLRLRHLNLQYNFYECSLVRVSYLNHDDLTISSENKSTDEYTDEWCFIPPAPVHMPTPAFLKDDLGQQLGRDEVTTTILPVECSDRMPSPFVKS